MRIMNNKVIDVVIKNFRQILDKFGVATAITEETELNRDMGIDSLGIVNLIVGIEEDLKIELDDYLAEIRNAHSVKELSVIIEKAYEKGV